VLRSAILKPYSLCSFVLVFEQRESDLIDALRENRIAGLIGILRAPRIALSAPGR